MTTVSDSASPTRFPPVRCGWIQDRPDLGLRPGVEPWELQGHDDEPLTVDIVELAPFSSKLPKMRRAPPDSLSHRPDRTTGLIAPTQSVWPAASATRA